MSMTDEEALEKHKEDCRRCKDKACERNIQCLQKKDIEIYEEIQQYRAIGSVSEFRELKEKATAKKPIMRPFLKCPTCNRAFLFTPVNYCYNCGTEFDWSEGKE